MEHFDVVILGAGLSGIGAAYRIQTICPNKSYVVLEARESMGGTWDYFKYPGLRSDSDMFTLGYPFRPWNSSSFFADGPAILNYIKETSAEFNIDKNIRYNQKVKSINWSSKDKTWTVAIQKGANGEITELTCNFFYSCAGYYSYKGGYKPEFKNESSFLGKVMHPQQWEVDYDYTDKKIVIIGSGATAVTLLPALSEKASFVTMLQRSPSYISSLPADDKIVKSLNKYFPQKIAHVLSRWKNILVGILFFNLSQKWPDFIKNLLLKNIKRQIGDNEEVINNFSPSYKPWDQRLCLVPNNNFFKPIRNKKAAVVTAEIDSFTPEGILLKNGKVLEADLIVTATGLVLELIGGISLTIDNQTPDPASLHTYRGVMLSSIPNFAIAIGYTNASWTLKCDLSNTYVSKIINYMDKNNFKTCVPQFDEKYRTNEPLLHLDSGYVQRAASILPRQGAKSPWRVYQNYIADLFSIKYSRIKGTGLFFE